MHIETRIGENGSPVVGRALVDFIVIGTMRAGTTLLHDILSTHPQISMARMKETDYFIPEKNHGRGSDWYLGQFDVGRPLRGEISPNYAKVMDFPGVARRIHAECPQVRLVYVLRDPVKRAMSQYEHSWNMGEVSETPAQMAGQHEYLSIMDTSHYARQLRAYHEVFRPEQILVVCFEDFIARPQQVLDRILAHIGAGPMAVPQMQKHNGNSELSRVPRPLLKLSHGPLRPLLTALMGPRLRGMLRSLLARGPKRESPRFPVALQQRMRDELREDIAELRRMTGQEFGQWSL
ncbi:MAG: sulfotransferase [Paracoccus sp. (in: a-proteobacteria)]|uniref:sulfotransferase family protein n=1 Tax=Paracoccus sp. TaxID=267 RepID=UPI0039E707C4